MRKTPTDREPFLNVNNSKLTAGLRITENWCIFYLWWCYFWGVYLYSYNLILLVVYNVTFGERANSVLVCEGATAKVESRCCRVKKKRRQFLKQTFSTPPSRCQLVKFQTFRHRSERHRAARGCVKAEKNKRKLRVTVTTTIAPPPLPHLY